MLFNSFIYFIFLFVFLPIYHKIPFKYKNPFLLISSYIFYGYWDWRFTLLLFISTVSDFYLGKKIFLSSNQKNRKYLLFASLSVNLGILSFFKYYNFFIDSFSILMNHFNLSLDYLHFNIILPVGISFYTFQTMSYTIDIYKRKLNPTNNIVDFAVFVSFFPQLVAGPIERAKNLLPQISIKNSPTKIQINEGIALIISGLFKKVLIGDTTGRIVDKIFAQPELYKSPELLSAIILFSIQIYADFSGYSNIARGTGKLLGIELMKNFQQPYFSRNITEFWRRWHISLSSWLTDYLYIPLGGNRKGLFRTYQNLLITMLLGGLWHGASWNFVIWGGLHGIYLAIHKFLLNGKKISIKMVNFNFNNIIKIIFTYLLVLFTWLFFRADSFESSIYFIKKIIFWESSDLTIRFFKITLSFIFITLAYDLVEHITKKHSFLVLISNKYYFRTGILFAISLVSFLYLFNSKPSPFMYFQF
ncbi:MAG: membrane-bound O-acyltransferase family protein [Candidatus Marinimicrobia bacterium]|nr:membrane-bound O-acyltransferase family protein [Candidatus Neomarinimicrobiota bacterium]